MYGRGAERAPIVAVTTYGLMMTVPSLHNWATSSVHIGTLLYESDRKFREVHHLGGY